MPAVSPSSTAQRAPARQPYLPPLVILAVLAVIGTVTYLGPVIKPVLVAVFVFLIIQPAAQWLTNRGLSSWLSYLLLLFVVILAGMLLVRVAYQNLYDLQRRIPQYEKRAIELISQIPGIDAEQFRRARPMPTGLKPDEAPPEGSTLFSPTTLSPAPLTPIPSEAATSTAFPEPVTEFPAADIPAPSATAPTVDGIAEATPGESPLTADTSSTEEDASTTEDSPAGTPATIPTELHQSEPKLIVAPTPETTIPVIPDATSPSILKPALPPRIPAPQAEQLEGKTILELFNITSEAIGRVLVKTTMEWLEGGLMVLFYLVFMILDAHRLPNRIRRALPETGEKVVEMGEDINQSITDYMRVKTLVSLGMAITAAMMMATFRLENWPLWALLTFLLNYVTYVGSLAALVPPVIIAFLQFENPAAAVTLAILLAGNRFLWIDYVEIRFAGRKLSINAVLLLVSLAYWGSFWGVTGLVLAVPMLTAAKIALEKFPSTRNWAILISED